MTLSTYAELQASIANWLNRDDLTDEIPEFVLACEADINRRMMHRRMICRAKATIAANSEYTTLPSDYISVQTLSLALTSTAAPTINCEYLDPRNLQARKPDEDDWSDNLAELHGDDGHPRFYTIVGTDLRLFPAPTQTYYAHLTCYERLPDLASNSTNWMLSKNPDVYLYGSLIHGSIFLQDDGRVPVWEARYERALAAALESDPPPSDKTRLRTEVAGLTNWRSTTELRL